MEHLGIHNRTAFEARGIFHNAEIAFGPIGPVHGVESHTGIAYVDLQPIAVALQLVRQAWTSCRLADDYRAAGWIKEAGALTARDTWGGYGRACEISKLGATNSGRWPLGTPSEDSFRPGSPF